MEVGEDKKNTQTPLDIRPLYFHIVSKFVQAPVIIYNEVFQALALEGDVLT
jgi:hypothetical protein